MRRLILLFTALLVAGTALAQSEYNYQRRSLLDVLPLHSRGIVFLGNSGWLLDRLDSILVAHPKKLFLMIGTNDLAAGISPEEIVRNVARLIDRFQSESKWTKIYVQSILPVNGEDFTKYRGHYEHARLIVPTNKMLEALCDEKGVTYLNVWGALADHDGKLDKRYTNDGLHLTGQGYLVWRDAIKIHVK